MTDLKHQKHLKELLKGYRGACAVTSDGVRVYISSRKGIDT